MSETDEQDRPPVPVTTDGHVAVVEVLRGPHNFFDLQVLGAVADALDSLADATVPASGLPLEWWRPRSADSGVPQPHAP